MKENRCDIIGTLRKDRKGLPISVVKAKMKTGQRKVSYEHKLRVMSLGWKDKRVVFLMGTCINDSLVTVKWRGFETVIPQIVNVYNNQMGGVDRSDQMLRSYEVERKRVKKWYKKQIMHLINVATFNSHILHKKKGGRLNPLEFRKKLVISLFEKYSNRSTTTTARRGRKSHENNPLQLTERHFPEYIPPTEKKENATRRCVVCSKHDKRRETRYHCVKCNVALCSAPCFSNYHTQKKF